MSDKDERVKDKIKRYTHAQVTFDDLVYGIVDRQDQIEELTEKFDKADAEVLRLDAEASVAYKALGELKENGFLECVVDPACGDCTVCRARNVLKGVSYVTGND